MNQVNIFLADDHSIVREGVKLILSQIEGYNVVGEADDGRKALEAIEQIMPDVAVLDISMPSMTGIDVARELKRVHPEIKIIILSQYDNDEYVAEVLAIGVDGYILKQDVSNALHDSIKVIIKGHNYLSPQVTTRVLEDYRSMTSDSRDEPQDDDQLHSPYRALTKREREILKLVSEGKKNREIASLLFISDQTVKVHRKNIMKKLNVNSISELVRYAMKHGLVE